MFRSATLRLTGWYLLVLMSLSIIFSVIIFQVASNEITAWLDRFQIAQESLLGAEGAGQIVAQRAADASVAVTRLSIELLYVNLFVLVLGGLGSYFLARRNLKPIEMAHEAQSRFTSDASHELRTPLAVMKTELEVALSDKRANVKSLRDVLSSNLEEVDKLSRLAEMLLNLSRLDNDKLKHGPVNLNKVTRSVLKDFRQPAKRISLTGGKQQTVRGNEMAISELIKILVDNALQYSPPDSHVSITISRQDEFAVFAITNIGMGISAQKLPHIFDRFYRADSSRTTGENKGYGLGLALAKRIVELHNGELSASSAPGHETTLTFHLSLYSSNAEKTTTRKEAI